MFSFLRFSLFVVLAVFFLSGCLNWQRIDQMVIEKNQQMADEAKEAIGNKVEEAKQELKRKAKEESYQVAEEAFRFVAESLTNEAKRRIDQWLEQQNLNQYGDPKDTMYAGGTPLFDESTGEGKDRYEYILEKHPELVEELNL